MDMGQRTQFMTNPGSGCNTTDTRSCEHGSRVALVLLLLLLVSRGTRGRVVVSLVAMRVSEQATLVVASGCLVGRSRWWGRIRTRRKMSGRIPLRTSSRLLDVVPALAVLVPLLSPTWGRSVIFHLLRISRTYQEALAAERPLALAGPLAEDPAHTAGAGHRAVVAHSQAVEGDNHRAGEDILADHRNHLAEDIAAVGVRQLEDHLGCRTNQQLLFGLRRHRRVHQSLCALEPVLVWYKLFGRMVFTIGLLLWLLVLVIVVEQLLHLLLEKVHGC